LGRRVALKVMKPEAAADEKARTRFLREAKTTAGLQHDHIISIYKVDEANGVPYLTMPVLVGETLENRVRSRGRLKVVEVMRIVREAAEGLACAHDAGLVHRDVKPANIWLEGDRGRVKLLDFGLVRSRADARITSSGMVIGTPAYMAPEQASGKDVDHRA